MPTQRASKKTCSERCYNAMSYVNRKLYKMSDFAEYLESLIKSGLHINPDHPLYAHQQEGEAQCHDAA